MLKKLSLGIPKLSRHLENSRPVIRVDWNVPVKNKIIQDNTRVQTTIPTIEEVYKHNPKSVVLLTHLGRPNGQINPNFSLQPLIPQFQKIINRKIHFLNNCYGPQIQSTIAKASNGQLFLCQNIRFNIQEQGKSKDESGKSVKADPNKVQKFRQQLTKLGDLYINDAFGTAHRAHSSIVGISHKIRAAGFLMKKQIEYIGKAIQAPQRPLTVILGGAKVQDKLQLVYNMIDIANNIIIGGGMAFTYLKKIYNINIGNSMFDQNAYKTIDQILKKARQKNVQIILPIDFICAMQMNEMAQTKIFDLHQGIPQGWKGFDCGPQTINLNKQIISKSKTIIWNGPQGVFQILPFKHGSVELLKDIVNQTKKGAISIVGGGDTVNLVKKQGKQQEISHLSTGGGASLQLLQNMTLPGIQFLSNIDEI